MSELKPCPFCGGEARIYMNDSDLDNIMWYCMCTNDRGCNVMPITLDQYSEEEAAAAWNTRHVETCQIIKSELDGQMWVYRHEFSCACGQRNLFTSCSTPPNYCPNCGRKVEG